MKKSPLNSLQTEVDAHYIYSQISKSEKNPHIKEIFEELSQIELGHARAMYNSLKKK
jgi:rubrerythrin